MLYFFLSHRQHKNAESSSFSDAAGETTEFDNPIYNDITDGTLSPGSTGANGGVMAAIVTVAKDKKNQGEACDDSPPPYTMGDSEHHPGPSSLVVGPLTPPSYSESEAVHVREGGATGSQSVGFVNLGFKFENECSSENKAYAGLNNGQHGGENIENGAQEMVIESVYSEPQNGAENECSNEGNHVACGLENECNIVLEAANYVYDNVGVSDSNGMNLKTNTENGYSTVGEVRTAENINTNMTRRGESLNCENQSSDTRISKETGNDQSVLQENECGTVSKLRSMFEK